MYQPLIVIDMQDFFGVSNNMRVTKNCKREIKESIVNNGHILFVEFSGCGDTLNILTDLCTGYKKVHYVSKWSDDGSSQIANELAAHKIPAKNIRVIGINTDCCVQSTVTGLHDIFPKSKIEVVADACASLWAQGTSRRVKLQQKNAHNNGLRNIANIGKVTLLNA